VLHSAAFGVYLFSVVVFMVLLLVNFANGAPHERFDFILQCIVTPFAIICYFISLSLLVVIFYHLSKVPEDAVSDSDSVSSYKSIEVAVFDEEAEVQARIWNQFLRDAKGIDDSQRNWCTESISVTPLQVYQSMLLPQQTKSPNIQKATSKSLI